MANISENEKAKALLLKYRAGECTPEEEERVRQWFETLGNDTALPGDDQADLAVQSIHKHVMQSIRRDNDNRRRSFVQRISIAATIIVALGTVAFFLLRSNTSISYRNISTTRGEKREVSLPDGSVVVLNASSTLGIPSDYGKTKRNVVLTGEGFFSVLRDVQHPFVVRSGNIQTEVLGTSFNIKAYASDSTIQVAVHSGKVRVNEQHQDATITLAAGITRNQVLEYYSTRREYEVRNGHADYIISWKDNMLYFEEASIEEIARVLERRYNTPIVLQNAAASHCRYTIQFKDQPLSKVLDVLASLSGIQYHVTGNQIIINPQNCN